MLEKSNPTTETCRTSTTIFFELLIYHGLEIFLFCPSGNYAGNSKGFYFLPTEAHDL